MLMGEFHHNIDEKGRIIIPSKLRNELGDNIVITRGFEDCLFVYSSSEWNIVISKLKNLPFTKKNARNFTRIFLSGAINCEFDKQGRINITTPLLNHASIIKECVIIGVNDRVEIWSKEKWDNYIKLSKDEYSTVADHLFEADFEV